MRIRHLAAGGAPGHRRDTPGTAGLLEVSDTGERRKGAPIRMVRRLDMSLTSIAEHPSDPIRRASLVRRWETGGAP